MARQTKKTRSRRPARSTPRPEGRPTATPRAGAGPVYRRGAKGPEVTRIQTRLKELGYYTGPLDADFGGGTESAVKSFQTAKGLSPDGRVGPATWTALFPDETIPKPALLGESLAYRCLALTGSFETNAAAPECFAGLSGDFDGQGMSLGVCQWNVGQGSLQPLLKRMEEEHGAELQGIFHDDYPIFSAWLKTDRAEQLDWVRQHQDPLRHRIVEPWRGYFKTLGRSEAFRRIQSEAAEALFQKARALCAVYGVQSDRATALFFDILVQNGSISPTTKAQILGDFPKTLPGPVR